MPKMLLTKNGQIPFLVSDPDYTRAAQFQWAANEQGYIYRTLGKKIIWLHRWLIHPQEDQLVDHIDGDPLNNQTENLRCCTYAQNGANRRVNRPVEGPKSSKYKGVGWLKSHQKWRAQIWTGGRKYGKSIFLGYFNDEIEAAKAYDEAAKIHFKEFARPNFPYSNPY